MPADQPYSFDNPFPATTPQPGSEYDPEAQAKMQYASEERGEALAAVIEMLQPYEPTSFIDRDGRRFQGLLLDEGIAGEIDTSSDLPLKINITKPSDTYLLSVVPSYIQGFASEADNSTHVMPTISATALDAGTAPTVSLTPVGSDGVEQKVEMILTFSDGTAGEEKILDSAAISVLAIGASWTSGTATTKSVRLGKIVWQGGIPTAYNYVLGSPSYCWPEPPDALDLTEKSFYVFEDGGTPSSGCSTLQFNKFTAKFIDLVDNEEQESYDVKDCFSVTNKGFFIFEEGTSDSECTELIFRKWTADFINPVAVPAEDVTLDLANCGAGSSDVPQFTPTFVESGPSSSYITIFPGWLMGPYSSGGDLEIPHMYQYPYMPQIGSTLLTAGTPPQLSLSSSATNYIYLQVPVTRRRKVLGDSNPLDSDSNTDGIVGIAVHTMKNDVGSDDSSAAWRGYSLFDVITYHVNGIPTFMKSTSGFPTDSDAYINLPFGKYTLDGAGAVTSETWYWYGPRVLPTPAFTVGGDANGWSDAGGSPSFGVTGADDAANPNEVSSGFLTP